jgi:hypothetical protein
MMKTYSELSQLTDFRSRFEYLKIGGQVAHSTFGGRRYLNQLLYRSPEWKKVRREVILRDNGCDLGLEDYPIYGTVLVHHINPLYEEDIVNRAHKVFDPENLITVSFDTHAAIHYGDYENVSKEFVQRAPNDTTPWLEV